MCVLKGREVFSLECLRTPSPLPAETVGIAQCYVALPQFWGGTRPPAGTWLVAPERPCWPVWGSSTQGSEHSPGQSLKGINATSVTAHTDCQSTTLLGRRVMK